MAQFVDIETAREFMKESLDKISAEEIHQICRDLGRKSEIFKLNLSREKIATMTVKELSDVMQLIFSIRRRSKKLIEQYNAANLIQWTKALLYDESPVSQRFETFCDHFDGLEINLRYDLASELLHFSDPEKYWLWTRWVWDPKTKTGALPLVITEDYELEATGLGESYLKVGKAMAFIHHVGEAAEFEVMRYGSFGVDTYLCSVYIVYVYTVLRMRMTQEFNKVMPGLPEFSKRLLGIHKLEERKYAS